MLQLEVLFFISSSSYVLIIIGDQMRQQVNKSEF